MEELQPLKLCYIDFLQIEEEGSIFVYSSFTPLFKQSERLILTCKANDWPHGKTLFRNGKVLCVKNRFEKISNKIIFQFYIQLLD